VLPELTLLPIGSQDPLTALSLARVLLDRVRSRERGAALRIYRPAPTAVFGARDRFLPGFPAAIEAALDHGLTPALRTLGGRVAVYTEGSLVVDHVEPADDLLSGTQERFTQFGLMYAAALRAVGVDAQMGEIPGEYCPGEHSVNVAGRIKAIGTAQRVTNRGWLFSSSIIVTDAARVRAALTDIEAALGVDWDPATGGAIDEIHPEVTVEQVHESLLAAYREHYTLVAGDFTAAELAAARPYNDRQRLPRG
jgi:octanoyl-[GcvH]:protein N-octanoyltransferase